MNTFKCPHLTALRYGPTVVLLVALGLRLPAQPLPPPVPAPPAPSATADDAVATNAPGPAGGPVAGRAEVIRNLRQAATNQPGPRRVSPSIVPLPTTSAPAAVPAAAVPTPAPVSPAGVPVGTDATTGTAAAVGDGTLLATAPPSAAAQELPVILAFRNAPLEQIFDQYSKLTGRVVLYPTQLQTQAITVTTAPEITLTREEGIQAIEGALALNQVTLIPLGDRFVKAVPAQQATMEGAPINRQDPSELPESEQFLTHVVQLKVALPSEVATLFGNFSKTQGGIVPIDSSMILVLRDYASNIKRMLELIDKIDVRPESNYVLEVIPIKYGKVSDFFETMNILIAGGGGGGMAAPRQRTTPTGGSTFGGSSRSLGTAGRYGTSSRYQQTSGLQRSQGMVQPQQQVGGAVPGTTPGATTFQQRLQTILNRAAGTSEIELLSDARIVPDERSNSLIVYANRQDMQMITNIVAKVDVLLAQVLIEGIVLAVRLTDQQEVGVSWLQKPKQFGQDFAGAGLINNGLGFLSGLTNFPSGQPSGFSYFGKIGDDFEVAIKAFAQDGRVRILQRPRVQTSHAVPGYFFSGSTVPYVTGFYDYGYGGVGGFGTRSQVEQVEVGVRLEVIPYITPDGLVVLDIFQDISQLGDYVRIDQNDVPTTTSRNAQATLSVRDGETIILGGYIEENRQSGKSGVPILKDIPGLGALFRSKSHNNRRDELMLLMHVTILKNPADASLQAEAEKSKFPGVSAAEREFSEGQEKLKERLK